jgi:uncharacterized membrane protein YfcA
MGNRLRVYVDWPTLAGFGAPAAAGALLGILSKRIDESGGLGIFIAIFMFVLPLGIASSYWLSCRVKDGPGQPWAFFSFFVSLGAWVLGICLYFGLAGVFDNKW